MSKKARRPARAATRPARRTLKAVPKRPKAAKPTPPAGERRTRNPESLRLRAIQPSLTVNDLERSVRFYIEVLGFILADRWLDDRGSLRGVMLKAGACELGLAQDDWARGKDRKKGEGLRLWCQTAQDIDALAGRIKEAGGRLTEEPTTPSWGRRMLAIDDPDGFHITIVQQG
jgi:predicted enzyme related to lactoylglutathione lyase